MSLEKQDDAVGCSDKKRLLAVRLVDWMVVAVKRSSGMVGLNICLVP